MVFSFDVTSLFISVADPHQCDPAFRFDADPDPAFHSAADPNFI